MESSHVSALHAKHADIDQQLRTESARPMPDTFRVAALKKRKLAIKEEIAGLAY